MGFWGTMGKIFDPKNIGTAAGFALGGPLGAGLGRTVGGIVPGFGGRESSLEGKGDLGRLLKDAATGAAIGSVASAVPGIKNLEGAFAGGGAAAPGAGVMPMTGGPGGLSEAAQGAWGQQLGGGAGQLGAGGAGAAGAVNPYTGGAGAQQMAFQAPNQSIMTSPYAAATEGLGAPSMGAESMMQTSMAPGGAFGESAGQIANLGTSAQDLTSQFNMANMGAQGTTGGMHANMPRAGMSGLEKAMLLQTGIGAIGELGGGIYDEIRRGQDRKWGAGILGDELLRDQGLNFSREQGAVGYLGNKPQGYNPQSYRAWSG